MRPESDFTPSMARRSDRWCKPCTNAYRRDIRSGKIATNHRTGDVCKSCGADISDRPVNVLHCSEQCRAATKNLRDPSIEQAKWLNRAYGMTLEERDRLMRGQGGRCAICKTKDAKVWHVDHCHDTGAVRGILCSMCNLGIGHFQDDPVRLRAAARYLSKASGGAQVEP